VAKIFHGQQAGCAYHLNRGNGRGEVFHKSQDYKAFLSLLTTAKARHLVKLFGFCLMPNHFHFERKAA
jgi:putative transposase